AKILIYIQLNKINTIIPYISSISNNTSQWFNGNMWKRYKDCPINPTSTFFGPDGILALVKSVVYVAYQPEVTATLEESQYKRIRTSWHANAKISIGPFSFGGGGGASADTATFDDATRTVRMTSKSPHPHIM